MTLRPAADPSSASPEPGVEAVTACATLADLPAGRTFEVGVVAGDDPLAKRLRASGLWPGALVERIGRAPFGDPLLFKLHGFRLALRRSEAARVGGTLADGRP